MIMQEVGEICMMFHFESSLTKHPTKIVLNYAALCSLYRSVYTVFLVKQHNMDIYTVAHALYRIILEMLKNSMMI